MSRITRLSAVGLVAAVPFAAPLGAAPAEAKKPKKAITKIYRDCADGKINKKHKVKNLKRAKRTLPRDIKQYTGCSKALKKELRRRK